MKAKNKEFWGSITIVISILLITIVAGAGILCWVVAIIHNYWITSLPYLPFDIGLALATIKMMTIMLGMGLSSIVKKL